MKDASNTTHPLTSTSRREFLKTTGTFAAASALAGITLPHVHAAGDETLQLALIGCGGRGTGAADNALKTSKQGPIKLVAMADVFQGNLDRSFNELNKKYSSQMDVPADRKFIGFDANQKAMDSLKPGDIAIFTTPLAFRWVHFKYAIEKRLNVFMEKPLTADGPTSRRMIQLAEEATAKNLKCAVGLMSRHTRSLQQLHQRIQDGELGDIILMRGYRMQGLIGSAWSEKWPGPPREPSELLWQIKRFHSFIWASGGAYSDFYIHHIDHLSWMKNAWPVMAQGIGGRHYRGDFVDQNFDNYAVEYTFPDGSKMYMDGRHMGGVESRYYSHVHGSKGFAIAARANDNGGPSAIYKGQNADSANLLWTSQVPSDQGNAYDNEWVSLVEAIRNNTPYNEVKRGVEASVATSMGRVSAHTGQAITFEEMLNSDHEYAPGADKFTMDSPPPLKSDANGKYPIPMPGLLKKREYEPQA